MKSSVIHHPLTFRTIRPDLIHVEKDGKCIGRLIQQPKWENFNAGQWRYWANGEPASPWFKDLEHAQHEVGDTH